MKIFGYLFFMYFYLKGVLKFRAENYISAELFFKKAAKHIKDRHNELFFQYYGQTLLSLKKIDRSFFYLSKAYDIYNKNGWRVVDDEEYRLAKDTLDALKYIDDNYKLKIDNFVYNKRIRHAESGTLVKK